MILCAFSISIYLDYLDSFRSKDIYFKLDFTKGPKDFVKIVNNFDNGNYGFESLQKRTDLEQFKNIELR